MNMLTNGPQPRISQEIKMVLQLAKNNKVGDWYLYQNHTEIIVYGCQLAPYKLPKYIPMRIFSLEYFRQIINSDEVNFLAVKKKTQFKMKNQFGPFICNNKEAGPEINKSYRKGSSNKSLGLFFIRTRIFLTKEFHPPRFLQILDLDIKSFITRFCHSKEMKWLSFESFHRDI